MLRFLSLEYWKARICGYKKPSDTQGYVGIVAITCPHCWQMCEVFFLRMTRMVTSAKTANVSITSKLALLFGKDKK